MERVPSADEFASMFWRASNQGTSGVARTPSQNELESYYNAMLGAGAGADAGGLGGFPTNTTTSREGTPGVGVGAPTFSADGGIPRVASIDFLRRMIMGQQAAAANAAAFGAMNVAAQMPGGATSPSGAMTPNTAAAFSAMASGANLSALGQLGQVAADAVGDDNGSKPKARGRKAGSAAGKAPAAKRGKAGAAAADKSAAGSKAKGAAAKKGGKAAAAKADSGKSRATSNKSTAVSAAAAKIEATSTGTEDDKSEGDSGDMDAAPGDVRRQRRMLSNRESARRSRRRKLEHVAQLEGQIASLNAELAVASHKASTMELRAAELLRENTAIKAEKERLLQLLREAGPPGAGASTPKAAPAIERKSSLQRISSNGDIKGRLGEGSPTIGSGTGFVPFRSLQSYENLLALQQEAAQRGK